MRHFYRLLMPIALLALTIQDGLTNHACSQDGGASDRQTADVDELLRRLDEIEQETREATGGNTGARTEQMAVLFEKSALGTYQFGNERIRYFVTRAILINLGDEPLTLATEDLVLLADGDEFRLSTLHQQLRASTIYAGGESLQFESVAPPDELPVPPGGSAAVWLMYSGMTPAPRVPEMTFRIAIGDQYQEVNVTEYQRGILGFREERLGPADCLALTTVAGELNTINAASFADELDRLGNQGVARVVVSWSETSAPLSQHVRDWLLSSRTATRTIQNNQMPVLPASISELHFVSLPGADNRMRQFNGNGVMIHADTAAAVSAALRTACEAIPRDELRRQVVFGSPLTRAAALIHGGSRLAAEDLPLVLRSMSDPDEQVRRGAIAALAHFSEPDAIDALIAAVHGDSADLSLAALEAMASSRYPTLHSRLLEYLDEAPLNARTEIVSVLSRYPRPEWSDVLFEFTKDEDPQLRLAAFQAIARVGHVRLVSVLADALRDDEEEIRNFAFVRLVAGSDRRSEQAAMDFALALLQTQPPNETVTLLLTRTRDQRSVPMLLKHLDEPGDHRDDVIHLIARVAGQAAIEPLVARFEGFSQDEQEHALGVLHELHAPQARELALAAIADRQQQLMPQATRILAGDGDPEAVEILAEVLRSDDPQSWPWVCNALRMIGTRSARRVLLDARESESDSRRSLATEQLRRLDRESPAYYVKEQGLARIREQKLEEAEAMFTLALQFDDEYSTAYSHRGFVRLRLDRVPEAQDDFEQAMAINPFDSQAVAGLAIARTLQGEYRNGIQLIEENSSRFPDDPIYAYNSACVYGRALEQLEEAEPTDERTAQMEDYRVRALLLLKQAVELNFSDWDTFRTDPDLDTLRELDEFQELLEEFAQNSEEEDAQAAEPQEQKKE